jgi:hypothetical protein
MPGLLGGTEVGAQSTYAIAFGRVHRAAQIGAQLVDAAFQIVGLLAYAEDDNTPVNSSRFRRNDTGVVDPDLVRGSVEMVCMIRAARSASGPAGTSASSNPSSRYTLLVELLEDERVLEADPPGGGRRDP